MTQDTYSLHKPVRYQFYRRRTLSYGINDLWQCDLVDVQHLSKHNNGIEFLLTIIDVFSKGYIPGWSDEVFTISRVHPSHPATFELQDLESEAIKGRFYAEELQKILKRLEDYWHVEKVLKRKGEGKNTEYYVKRKGFDNRFNSWVKTGWMKCVGSWCGECSEELGEKGLLESRSPTFRIDSSKNDMRRSGLEGPEETETI
ncbi:uncharacterized transposon-derived protein F54H12.3 [Trichonephila clavipes]|nr:uncharacterized transposon-derived protein F54H12.3 [Trichonephila clavipes]